MRPLRAAAGLDGPKSLGESGHVFTLSRPCERACLWRCASRPPLPVIIATSPAGQGPKTHLVAVERRRDRIRIFCQDWMLRQRPGAISPRLCGLVEVIARVPPSCLPLLADISDGEDGGAGIVSFCSRDPAAILIPDHMFVLTGGYKDHRSIARLNATPWDERSDWIVWRGSTNGPGVISKPHLSADDPELLPRVRLCLALKNVARVDAKLSGITQSSNVTLDAERLARAGINGDYLSPLTWHGLKFAIDIDGNSNAWANLFMRLLMGCCVLKVASPSGYRQWYYDEIAPWRHFVPVAADLSDLRERIAWCRANPAACRDIAAHGQAFAMARDFGTETAQAVRRVLDAHRAGTLRRTVACGTTPSRADTGPGSTRNDSSPMAFHDLGLEREARQAVWGFLARRQLGAGRRRVNLVSYPRSGNTLTRTYFSFLQGRPQFSMYAGDVVPAAAAALTSALDGIELVKSHQMPSDESAMIYLVRDGRNATLSFLYLAFLSGGHRYSELSEVYEGIRHLDAAEGSWADHVAAAMHQAQTRPTLFVRYEDLMSEPQACLAAMARFAGAEVSPDVLAECVQRQKHSDAYAKQPASGHLHEPARGSIYDILKRYRREDYWRRILDGRSKRYLDEIGSTPLLMHFGYERSAGWWNE